MLFNGLQLTWPYLLLQRLAPDIDSCAGEMVRLLVRQGMSCRLPRLQPLQLSESMQMPQMTSSIWLPRWWQAPCWMLSLFWSSTQLKVSPFCEPDLRGPSPEFSHGHALLSWRIHTPSSILARSKPSVAASTMHDCLTHKCCQKLPAYQMLHVSSMIGWS